MAGEFVDREERVLAYALLLEQGCGFRVSDPTPTAWDLSHVTPQIEREMREAAELAEVAVEILKVGDEARCRPRRARIAAAMESDLDYVRERSRERT